MCVGGLGGGNRIGGGREENFQSAGGGGQSPIPKLGKTKTAGKRGHLAFYLVLKTPFCKRYSIQNKRAVICHSMTTSKYHTLYIHLRKGEKLVIFMHSRVCDYIKGGYLTNSLLCPLAFYSTFLCKGNYSKNRSLIKFYIKKLKLQTFFFGTVLLS